MFAYLTPGVFSATKNLLTNSKKLFMQHPREDVVLLTACRDGTSNTM